MARRDEQRLVFRATAGNVRDHTIVSLALGTGLRRQLVLRLHLSRTSQRASPGGKEGTSQSA